jgi:methionyl-tRNA synthetase
VLRLFIHTNDTTVENTDKLLRLSVDFGEETPRQVVSGIAGYFPDEQVLVGKKCPFVTNLAPRTIRGLESQAMIVAVHTAEDAFSLLEPTMADVPGGTTLN